MNNKIRVRLVNDNGLFIKDAFVDKIPLATETVTESYTDIDDIIKEHEVIKPLLDEHGFTYLDKHYVTTPCPQGFILPKWDGTQWVEGGVAKEPVITIGDLKRQLADTDYKIVKCSEYQLAGIELPYDIAGLHEDRQALRDKINELEGA